MITTQDLRNYVRATPADDVDLGRSLDQAQSMLTTTIGSFDVPQVEFDGWLLHLASELWHRRSAPGGIISFADEGPVRQPLDPMVAIMPMIRKYVPAGL